MSVEALMRRIDAAMGDRPLDMVVHGARVVNVYTGEIEVADVGIVDDTIVWLGELSQERLDEAGEVLDWSGRTVVPGFFDPHFHIGGSQLRIPELARALLARGTTTIVSDLQEIYAYAGKQGVRYILDEAAGSGLRVFFVPAAHLLGMERRGQYAHAVDADEMIEMLDWPEVVGINEPPPEMVLGKNPGTLKVLDAARERGLAFPGHLPGVLGTPLQAYAAAGATSDHESQSAEEAIQKLRLGLWTMMREGSAAVDLENVLPMLGQFPEATRWAMLCSDEQDAPEIVDIGNVDNKIRIALRGGISTVDAVRMGTVNPALYYRVDHLVGSIAPGKLADLVAVEDLESFQVTDVIAAGRVVVRDREVLVKPAPPDYPEALQSRVRWARPIEPADFRVPADGVEANVRVIGVEDGSLVAERLEATLPVADGGVLAAPERDILKIAVINRHRPDRELSTAFIQGLGLENGAVASTYCHVHYNALVIGTDDDQMALAAQELAALGGGVVVISNGEPVMSWALPLVGVFATDPLEKAQQDLAATNDALKKIGCKFSSPILGLSFVALTTIPSYGMTERGLFEVQEERFVPCVIEPAV
ncbi:MAG TPA: adenine deaminase C-terminal domain-containing protein [Thermoleophilaceae bacterium]|nr:adenine deaminase C-terminal domain-containing protein [Thermoleophilaceae bacterium]